MENFGQTETFNNIIIVPTENIHDSGYRCMKFALVRAGKIVGCVGGYSDAVHPNGISNWGLYPDLNMYMQGFIPALNMSIDCLKESGCLEKTFLNVMSFAVQIFNFI